MLHRTKGFADRDHDRYWWFKSVRPAYDPPVISVLSDDEWEVMTDWLADSEARFPAGTGECAIPAMTMLQSLIMGNNLSRVVQLGHFIGFSSLFLGFFARRMGKKNTIFSVDIDWDVTEYTRGWIEKAGLSEQIEFVVKDSAAEGLPEEAAAYLGGPPQLIFIDSSHAYQHTIDELNRWYPALQPGGLILLHDVSKFASRFDYSSSGGVEKAISDWSEGKTVPRLLLNGDLTNQFGEQLTYQDGCGLGMIQKPFM